MARSKQNAVKTSTSATPPQWNLGDFYKSPKDPQLAKDRAELKKITENFAKNYHGKMAALDAAGLLKALKSYEKISDLSGKISSYSYLLYATQLQNVEVVKFFQSVNEEMTALSALLVFFTLEINKMDEKKIKSLFADKALSIYAPWVRDVRVYREHQLSEDLEKILLDTSLSGRQAWVRLFDETMARLQFPFGKTNVSAAVIFDKLSSRDGAIRKSASQSISKVLGENLPLFTHITNTLAKDKETSDRWRNFSKPISSRNLSNLVEDEVVETLISTVRENYKHLSHRYYGLKAKWFKTKALNFWDRNAPLPFDADKKISWNEAREIVLGAYHDFSPQIASIAQRFFDEKWIDAAVYQGKESGAFSHPTVPSVHPYVLMNFQGKLRDVMTLAHELGHGVHQVLAAKQGVLMCDTPLTLAETASVFGEQLTFRALLKNEKNKTLKKAMIAHKVEDMLNTVVRQVAFCEFERKVHDGRRKGELSADQLNAFWLEVQSESLGPSIKLGKEYGSYWAYIPHFIHSPFYVYAYAFGDCLVNSLYRVYQESPKGFEKKYITMLEAGGTLHHKDLLKPFGLNAAKSDFWQKGMDVIREMIEELE